MSGRPAAPSYVTRTWATDTNYAAGAQPWSSQPIKVEPPSPAGGFVPGQGAGAPYFNKLLNDAFTQDAAAKTYQTTLLEYVGQMQGLNWPQRTAVTLAGKKSALYNRALRWWFIFAEDHGRAFSSDQGHEWTSSSADPSDTYISGDQDSIGRMVIGKASRYAHHFDLSTWNDRDIYGAAFTNAARVVYDPIHTKWFWLAVDSAGVPKYSQSTDGVTWDSLLSANGAGGTFLNNADPRFGLAVNKTTGRVVFGAINSANGNIQFAYRDAGGFIYPASLACTIVSPTIVEMSFNEDEGAFYFVVGETSGTNTCEVWRSVDGATWTKQVTITGWALREIAALGAILVAVAAGGDVMYSIDQGASWRIAGIAVSGTPVGVYVGAGRPMIVTSSHIYMGLAAGLPAGVFAP